MLFKTRLAKRCSLPEMEAGATGRALNGGRPRRSQRQRKDTGAAKIKEECDRAC